MTERLLLDPRSRAVLRRVAAGERVYMPCGELRVASRLVARGYLLLRAPKRRDFTDAYELTETGRQALPSL